MELVSIGIVLFAVGVVSFSRMEISKEKYSKLTKMVNLTNMDWVILCNYN